MPTRSDVEPEILAELQARLPDLDIAGILAQPGRATVAEVRDTLFRLGYSDDVIDELAPADA